MTDDLIVDLSAEKLRQFIAEQHEKNFLLVDVRQPGEYEVAHLPGARLMPLMNLVQDMDQLPSDRRLVFYCRSGSRSMAAAAMVADEQITDQPIYNLDGGIMAWDGRTVADYPRLALFNAGRDATDMLHLAMDLEKGAQRFYVHVEQQFAGADWSATFGQLAKAERAHARTVYGYLTRLKNIDQDFDAVFENLSGEILEGGQPLETALYQVAAIDGAPCLALVELALRIEVAAYDLYRNVAEQSQDVEARQAFLSIAQAEKAHMRSLARSLAQCPESAGS